MTGRRKKTHLSLRNRAAFEWHDADAWERAPGCTQCPLLSVCGGLHVRAGLIDCSEYCTCARGIPCKFVCRKKAREYALRVAEVRGFSLDNVPRVSPPPSRNIAGVVPFVAGKYARVPQSENLVAVSLYDLIPSLRSARPRSAVEERFGLDASTQLVVSGVAKDHLVEKWWAMSLVERQALLSLMKDVGVIVLTVPNFSLFANSPREDNLHAMKRIALIWAESMAAGIQSALHLNARTDRDYERWSEFVGERNEVTSLSFEFATGCGDPRRIDWHVRHLTELARSAPRPLDLFVRGGTRKLAILRESFARVAVVDTDAYLRTVNRRRAYITMGNRLRWGRSPTKADAPIDGLLATNIRTVRSYLEGS